MRDDLKDHDILVVCQPLINQLSWRFVANQYFYQLNWEDRRPLSVSGSLKGGGRFNVSWRLAEANPNVEAFGALYTSFKPETATAEMRFPSAEETLYMLLPVRSTLERCLDLRDAKVLAALGIDPKQLGEAWREKSKILLEPSYSQRTAARLQTALVEGILTHSVASEGTNLTLFPNNLRGDSRVSVTVSDDDPTVRDVLLAS